VPEPQGQGELKEAPLVEHLEELRARILKALLFWALGTAVAYAFRVPLLAWLKAPLDRAAEINHTQVNLIVLDITEPFITALRFLEGWSWRFPSSSTRPGPLSPPASTPTSAAWPGPSS